MLVFNSHFCIGVSSRIGDMKEVHFYCFVCAELRCRRGEDIGGSWLGWTIVYVGWEARHGKVNDEFTMEPFQSEI